MEKVKKLKEMLDRAQKIVFFTGAGISVPSGIPDFRSASGLYKNNLRAEEIISHHYFIKDPEDFYDFYKKKMCFPSALPNLAHKFIARLEKEGKVLAVITQNIDGLHQKAGSKNVIELHGTIYKNHCLKCHETYDLDYILNSDGIPYCKKCGGIIKPDVTLYEESLDERAVYGAIDALMQADLLIIVGTSLVVYPAASYIDYYRNDDIVIINKGEIDTRRQATLVFDDDVINVIKELEDV